MQGYKLVVLAIIVILTNVTAEVVAQKCAAYNDKKLRSVDDHMKGK